MMTKISYSGYRFPSEIIQQAIWLYVRFTLSFRDVEDLLAERGIVVSYEGSAHESALYAPFTRTNAEFKERIKADDTDATRWLSPTVIARGRKMWTRARVGHSRAALPGSCHKCRTFEKQRSIKPLRTSKRHESNRQRRCCMFVRARGA
jgi:hypothetical protein